MKKAVTRRGFMGRAAATAGALSTFATTAMPNVAQAGVSAQARLQGKLQVVQAADFNSDHNAYVKRTIEEFVASQRWELDHSDLAGFVGATAVLQKFEAEKAAGQAADVVIHSESTLPRLMHVYNLARDAAPVINRAIQKYGRVLSSANINARISGKWIAAPFFDRTDGYWVRADKLAEAGVPLETLDTWDGVREAARAITRPDQGFYGWGMTTNRSGDGEYLMWRIIHAFGGALTDPTGTIVTFLSPETIDAMEWLKDVYTNPSYQSTLPPGVNAWNDLSNNEAYLAGTIGITSNAGTLLASARFNGNPVAELTAFLPNPIGPFGQRIAFSNPSFMYFMDGGRNFDAAAMLAEHLLSEDAQRGLYRTSSGYAVPAYDGLWNTPEIQADTQVSLKYREVSQAEPPVSGNAYRGPQTDASQAALFQQFATDMFGEILAGKPVIQAVIETDQRVKRIYAEFGIGR